MKGTYVVPPLGGLPLRVAVLILSAVAVMLTGCHSARRGEPITGPMQITDPDVAKGQIVFMQHCQQCHPFGQGGLGPVINNTPAPRFLVKTQVRLGLGVMPGFSKDKISPEELDYLVDYVMALRRAD